MRYTPEDVALGKRAVMSKTAANWQLGDIALKIAPTPSDMPDLFDYSLEIGMEYSSLQELRGIAAAWPAEHRNTEVAHSVHRLFRAQDDRFQLIKSRAWSFRTAERFLADRAAEKRGNRRPDFTPTPRPVPTPAERASATAARDQAAAQFQPVQDAVAGVGATFVADGLRQTAELLHRAVESDVEIGDFDVLTTYITGIVEDMKVYAFKRSLDVALPEVTR